MSFISADRRPLAMIAVARGVSWLGDEVALVALLLRVQSSGAGSVAALLLCGTAPIVLLAGVVGRLVDRYDTRLLLTISSAAQAVVCVALAVVGTSSAVFVLVAALGVGQALNAAAWTAAVPALAAPGDVALGVAWLQAGVTGAGIIAPGVGGVLSGEFGTGVPLLVDAASFLAVLAIGLALPSMQHAAVDGSSRDSGGLMIVRRDPLLLTLFVVVGGFVLVGATVNVVEVFLVRDTLGASSTWFGVCGSVYAVGALVGTLVAGRWADTVVMTRAFVVAAMVLGAGLAVMGLAPSVWWLLPAGLVAGVGQGAMNVAIRSLVIMRARGDQVGRVSALLNAVVSATQLAAFGVGAALAGVAGPRLVFVVGGAAALAVPAVLGHRMVRAARRPGRADLAPMTCRPSAA